MSWIHVSDGYGVMNFNTHLSENPISFDGVDAASLAEQKATLFFKSTLFCL